MARIDTEVVHGGRGELTALGVHAPPLDRSTTYPLPSLALGTADLERLAQGAAGPARSPL
jgi:methionine-gamma-lyase